MNLPNKVEPIKPNYHEDDAIALLERWYDEWSNDEDWWHGSKTWDLNIFAYDDENPNDYTINVYGLVKHDDDELLHIDTSNEIDFFELKL